MQFTLLRIQNNEVQLSHFKAFERTGNETRIHIIEKTNLRDTLQLAHKQ
jgi:hypothetical protein